jgi:hypothetical protein
MWRATPQAAWSEPKEALHVASDAAAGGLERAKRKEPTAGGSVGSSRCGTASEGGSSCGTLSDAAAPEGGPGRRLLLLVQFAHQQADSSNSYSR